jgi:hypothetical protein
MKKLSVILAVFIFTSVCLAAPEQANYAVDYSKVDNWLSLPARVDKKVDIFYLYPTAYHKANSTDPNIGAINNAIMRKTAELAFQRQATAFGPVGNIYAPYYRQVDTASILSLPLNEQDRLLSGVIKSDVFTAFEYYIQHYNHGRPFILAGHSQGSNMLLYLLAEYMSKHPAVYQRMIAAYVIGYSVTKEYLAKNPHLKFAAGANDTGVIISYNTEAPTIEGDNPVIRPGALAINPINWRRDETLATADANLGSIMLKRDGSVVLNEAGGYQRVINYADARVDLTRGALICSTADVESLAPGNGMFGKGVFHVFDYAFYYYNIRKNAANRVDHYRLSQVFNPPGAES